MLHFDCEVLYEPTDDSLAYLPEGPIDCGQGKFSWVAIQHGPRARAGSLNIFDLSTGANESHRLEGRPGFAFPTTEPDVFVVGAERSLGLLNLTSTAWTELCSGIDHAVSGTVINDGVICPGGLIFGCKDLEFKTPQAGLYYWRQHDRQLRQLRSDQTCSNGKVVLLEGRNIRFLDIDSPTKTVVQYDLDTETGELGEAAVALDLRDVDAFPDGMVLAPGGESVIIAFYNPHDAPQGEARQYRLADGQLEACWRTPQSPRVTCPLLIEHQGQVKLVLTTAVEHMTLAERQHNPRAGCLFIGDTPFAGIPSTPHFQI